MQRVMCPARGMLLLDQLRACRRARGEFCHRIDESQDPGCRAGDPGRGDPKAVQHSSSSSKIERMASI